MSQNRNFPCFDLEISAFSPVQENMRKSTLTANAQPTSTKRLFTLIQPTEMEPKSQVKWPSTFCPPRSSAALGDRVKDLQKNNLNPKKFRSSICGDNVGGFAGCFETPPYQHRKRFLRQKFIEIERPSSKQTDSARKIRSITCLDKQNNAKRKKPSAIPSSIHLQPSSFKPPTSAGIPPAQTTFDFLQQARSKNLLYLQHLQASSHQQFQNYLNGHPTASASQWSFGQSSLFRKPVDSQNIYFLNIWINYLENVQDNIDRILKASSLRVNRQQKREEVLAVEECEKLSKLWELDRDIHTREIDTILNKLHHFSILSKKARIQIIQISALVSVEQQVEIIKKDTAADSLYILLKGSAQKIRLQLIHNTQKQLANSLYDGQIFGFADGQVYDYCVMTREPCLLMKIPYQQYVLIQSDFLLNELSGKIEALSKLHCYKDVPVRNLVPLAGLLKEKKVRNGDYVLKEGDKVEGFMIIVSGTAVVTKQTTITRKRSVKRNSFAKHPFSTTNALKSFRSPLPFPNCTPLPIKSASPNRRTLKNYDLLSQNDNQIGYYYSCDLKHLQCGHTLLHRAISQGLARSTRSPTVLVSVIATSNNCVILELPCEQVCKLPEYLLHRLEEWCEDERDFDEVYGEEVAHRMQQEERFKVKLCNTISADRINRKCIRSFR